MPTLRRRPRALEGFVDWRARCLRNAGFTRRLADRLAGDTGFDLHALLELVDRGCPPEVAARIVAPLDRQEPRP